MSNDCSSTLVPKTPVHEQKSFDPNDRYWCSGCKQYKVGHEFSPSALLSRNHCRECGRRYRDKNRERKRELDRLYHRKHAAEDRARVKAWAKANPDKDKTNRKLAHNRRRARSKNLPDTCTNLDWQNALIYWDNRCAACGRRVGLWHSIAQDHWIPIGSPDCPGTVADNIIPLCHARKGGTDGCNNSKHNRDPHEWLVATFGERKAAQIEKRVAEYFSWVREQKKPSD